MDGDEVPYEILKLPIVEVRDRQDEFARFLANRLCNKFHLNRMNAETSVLRLHLAEKKFDSFEQYREFVGRHEADLRQFIYECVEEFMEDEDGHRMQR